MKCNLYETNAGSPLAKSFTDAIDVSSSDDAKAAMGADALKVYTSLTGFECHKPTVKFGQLKSDWCAGGPRQPEHKAGDGVVVAEVANGIRFAVFEPPKAEDLAAAIASHTAPPPEPAPAAPSVIVPPPPTPGVTGADTGVHDTKPD